jgi:major intracellular serine protease
MYKLHPYQTQQATVRSAPINIIQVNAKSYWTYAKGVAPVVAIIDSGIDTTHPEFAGRIFMPKSFNGELMGDSEGHGTHVAGIIASETCGMFPEARIMPLKVQFGNDKTVEQILDAFLYIMDHNKTAKDEDKVVAVNCSFDGPVNMLMAYYIRELTDNNVSVVVAAGNRGDGDPDTIECFSYPGFLWEVITTGALDNLGDVAGYSSSYDGIDIAAPGSQIYSAWSGGGYMLLSGTSMATPHVTGAVALIKAAYRNKYGRWPTTEETERILFNQVRPHTLDKRFVGNGPLFMSPTPLTKVCKMDTAPKIENGRTLVPLRAIAEGLGARVDWDSCNQVATVEQGDKSVEMTIGAKTFRVTQKPY